MLRATVYRLYIHGKAAQSSSKDQVAWLHLWPCLVPSWCGDSRTVWNCCWSWGISSPSRAAAPATLPKGKAGTKMSEWICRPTWNLSIYEIVFSLFAKSECLIQITKLIWTETSVFVKINSIRHRSENGCWHTKPPPQHPLKNTALNLILIQIPVVHCNMIYFWSDVLTDKL